MATAATLAGPATTVLRRDNAVVQATWTPPETLDLLVTDGRRAWRATTSTARKAALLVRQAGETLTRLIAVGISC